MGLARSGWTRCSTKIQSDMTWETLDWAALDRLRETFLTGGGRAGPYWNAANDLASYDFTFGERIGWKWDAVLRELRWRGWRPAAQTVLDWGCGSGVAGRRVIGFFGAEHFARLVVHDQAALATDFAVTAARRVFPQLTVEGALPAFLRGSDSIGLLVISHVLNELSEAARQELSGLIGRAQAVLWVEPGTSEVARELVGFRERLRPMFRMVAPCTHQSACGLLAPENAAHWCHHFAAPPPGVFTDSNWMKFARRAGIDLRSLPYSFLVMERAMAATGVANPEGGARVLGEPRFYKGFARLLSCDAAGVSDLMLQKRDAPEFFKSLKRGSDLPPLHRWQRTGGRITAPEPFAP